VLGSALDANGNTLSDAQGRGFTWDFENRLTQIVNPGMGTTTFRYDPFGRRIQKLGPLGTTNYLYDGVNILETTDQNGNAIARYTTTRALDEKFVELSSGTYGYYEQDGVGSVTSLSGTTGTLANTYTLDSFGRLTGSTGNLANPFGFTGRDLDPETGLNYYRARYYDPNLGRFISPDPIGFGAGVNFYRYVENNPVLLTDPFGLCPPDGPDPCQKYNQCGRPDLGGICRAFGSSPTNDCVRTCLQQNFDCRSKAYNDPWWGGLGPVVHYRCFKKCGIPIPNPVPKNGGQPTGPGPWGMSPQ